MKILLLEDEVMLQGAVSEYLQMHNHRVDAFVDGAEALEAIMKGGYDLLILDINVPSIDGLSLLERLNEVKVAVPAIFTSALPPAGASLAHQPGHARRPARAAQTPAPL